MIQLYSLVFLPWPEINIVWFISAVIVNDQPDMQYMRIDCGCASVLHNTCWINKTMEILVFRHQMHCLQNIDKITIKRSSDATLMVGGLTSIYLPQIRMAFSDTLLFFYISRNWFIRFLGPIEVWRGYGLAMPGCTGGRSMEGIRLDARGSHW